MTRPETWLVLTVAVPEGDPRRDLTSEGLLALGGSSVLESPGALTTYLPATKDGDDQLREAERFLADWTGAEPPPVTGELRMDEDWEVDWRRGLKPRKVSPRLIIKPSWTEWEAAPGEVVIEIDPQMAFGTGEHATTRGCLQLLDETIRTGDRALDAGSGSGILSIAAARLGAGSVVAIEFEADSNLNARENIARNGVDGVITLHERVADGPFLESIGSFDLILANILSGVIKPLLPPFARILRPGGRLIIAGVLQLESEDMRAAVTDAGFTISREIREEEWWTALLTRD